MKEAEVRAHVKPMTQTAALETQPADAPPASPRGLPPAGAATHLRSCREMALEALQRFDVRIAMDDFGSGFTSLASLQALPIDVLKIDQRFVTGMLGGQISVDSAPGAGVRFTLDLPLTAPEHPALDAEGNENAPGA